MFFALLNNECSKTVGTAQSYTFTWIILQRTYNCIYQRCMIVRTIITEIIVPNIDIVILHCDEQIINSIS